MAADSTQTDENRTTPVWTSPSFLVAAGFVVLVVVLAVVVVINRESGSTGQAPAPGPNPAASPGTAAGPSEGSSGLDTAVPTTAPPTNWSVYKTLALPSSPTVGPSMSDRDVVYGFAHSPTGALFAAAQIGARQALSNNYESLAKHSLSTGPGLDAWLKFRRSAGRFADPEPGSLCQIAGFRFVDYTTERASLQTVSRCSSGTLQLTTSAVSWDGQDWRVVLQPDGGLSPNAQALSSLDGFIPWGGV